MDLGLKGMKAVLAGASKGIGLATARTLASEGCDVAICARGAAGVDAAVASIGSFGGKAIGESVDLRDADAYRAWVSRAAEQLGGCDIFVCFATGGGGLASEETWKNTFELDVLATWRGIDAAMPHLEKSKAGAIVVISSTAALEEFVVPQAYNAMKAALINYAAALSQQLAPKGIRVNTVSPGPVFIEDGAWDGVKQRNPAMYEKTLASIPTGRMSTADEIARVIAFAASPVCPSLVGANLVVDGGFTKRVQY